MAFMTFFVVAFMSFVPVLFMVFVTIFVVVFMSLFIVMHVLWEGEVVCSVLGMNFGMYVRFHGERVAFKGALNHQFAKLGYEH